MAILLSDYENKYLNQAGGEVNKLYDLQKQNQLAELRKQRDTAIGKLNQQKNVTRQDYYNQKNQADVVQAQGVQRLRELMASNGISTSGDNLTLNARANSDRMNTLGALNQQEQAKMNDYDSQISDWNSPSRDEAIVNAIETERTRALMDAQNQAREKAWREYQFDLEREQAAADAAARARASSSRSRASSGTTSASSNQDELAALYQEYLASQGQPTNFFMTPTEQKKRAVSPYAGMNTKAGRAVAKASSTKATSTKMTANERKRRGL